MLDSGGEIDTVVKEIGTLSDGVLYTLDGTYHTASYGVEVDVVVADTGDDPHILAVRVQDANHYYALRFNASVFQMYKLTLAGGLVALGSDQGAIVSNGNTVRLEVRGTTIQAVVNEVKKVSVTDSSITAAGKAGYGMGAVIFSNDDMSTQEISRIQVDDRPMIA